MLHEANAVPGRAVSFLSRFSNVTALSFPEAGHHLPGAKTQLTGLPIRPTNPNRFPPGTLEDGRPTVLVMGGSQGAHALNKLCGDALCALHRQGVPLQVVHLAGPIDEEAVRARYEAAGVRAVVFGFLEDMGRAYNAAHCAVSRSGAGSCAELCAYRVPALLVRCRVTARPPGGERPSAGGSRRGRPARRQGTLTVENLAAQLRAWLQNAPELARMKSRYPAVDSGAAERLADLAASVAHARRAR